MAETRDIRAEALSAARRQFAAGKPLDVNALATELGVDRTTLFRRAGNRDTITGDVLDSLARRTWRMGLEECGGSGASRVVDVLTYHARATIETEFFRTYLTREPQKALCILTTGLGPIQGTMVESVRRLIEAEIPEQIRPDLPVEDMAYLLVRVGESFIYNDLLTGGTPDTEKARVTSVPSFRFLSFRESASNASYFIAMPGCMTQSGWWDRHKAPHLVPSGPDDACGGFGNLVPGAGKVT